MSAIHRNVPDRVPWALWGHFPSLPFLKYYSWEKANRDGEELAKAHIALLNELDYKMDLLKVSPFFRYMAFHWGARFRFTNNEEVVKPVEVPVKEPEDWAKLSILDPRKELGENLRTISVLSREIGRRMPFIYTIASPMVQALHHVSTPQRVYVDMKTQPDLLRQGIETIAQTCIDFGKACIDEGATGIFYSIGSAGDFWSRMNEKQLNEYVLNYDKKVLNAFENAPIKLLHICSTKKENPEQNGGLMEKGWFANYPADAINWSDTKFTPSSIAKRIYGHKFCIVGGVDQSHTMKYGKPHEVEEKIKASIEGAAEGGGFIIGPGCILRQETPLANFNAVARAVERYGKYRS